MYSERGEPCHPVHPVLRLRSNASAQSGEPDPSRGTTNRDGPLVPHPSFLRETPSTAYPNPSVDITREGHRAKWKEEQAKLDDLVRELKKNNEFSLPKILDVNIMWPPVDMMRRNGRTDDDLETALEKYYIGAQQYSPCPVSCVKFEPTNLKKLSYTG